MLDQYYLKNLKTMCLVFFHCCHTQVAVKLSQVQPSTGEQKPLLHIVVGNMKADVVDRKWDTQGSITMKSITILDYITKGASLQ